MRDLTEGPIAGHLLGMAAFIGISLVFQTMYFIVDLYFVSRLGSAAIAGVSASGNVFFLTLAASQLISIGVMATVAQAVGKKDEAETNLFSDQAISMSLLFGAATLALGYAFGGIGVDALTADAASAAAGRAYLFAFLAQLALMFPVAAMTFRHKEDIVTGLYDRYEAAIGEVIGGADGEAGAVDDLWLIVHLAFEVIHDYRFIHRDLSELSTAYPPVRARFQRGLERGIEQTTQYCRALAEQGALDATPEEAHALAINMSLVTTYWLNLQTLRDAGRGQGAPPGSDAISLGVFQVLSLITPYLRGEIKDDFRRVALRYLPSA